MTRSAAEHPTGHPSVLAPVARRWKLIAGVTALATAAVCVVGIALPPAATREGRAPQPAGSGASGVSAPPATEAVPDASPQTVPAPVWQGDFNPTGIGAAVSGAANGDFNRWTGQRHSMYSTWADNGKVWALDTPSSEYGADSVAWLGDYDLDIATQHLIGSWAAPGIDAALEATFAEIKEKWGNRQGHVYIRPFHEFNGDWYNWSIRSAADQVSFVEYWRNVVHPKFTHVFGDDPRFHLTWSPNRDSRYGLDVRNAFPGAQYVDAIGLNYYDYSGADTEIEWALEEYATQNGGSPIGIGAWRQYAQEQQVPIYLPEFGVQFGDNPLFLQKVLEYIDTYRYSGDGDASGRILNAVWHNLRKDWGTPDGGGDFFVQTDATDYPGRPETARVLRDWTSQRDWLATPPCTGPACTGN